MLRKHHVDVGQMRKLSPYFEGPFKVIEEARPDYVIQVNGRPRRVHGANLKLFSRRNEGDKITEEDIVENKEEESVVIGINDFEEERVEEEERVATECSSDEDDNNEDPLAFVRGLSRAGRQRKKKTLFEP